MPSSTNFLDNTSSSLSYLKETRFENTLILTYPSARTLAEYITNPDFFTSVFIQPNGWLTSLVAYPFSCQNVYDDDLGSELRFPIINGRMSVPNVLANEYRRAVPLYHMGNYVNSRRFNDFRDYDPYTKYKVYLPYYGFTDLSANDVVGKLIRFHLAIDYTDSEGMGQWIITVRGINETIQPSDSYLEFNTLDPADRVIKILPVQIGIPIPLGSTNAADVKRNLAIGGITAIAGLFAKNPVGVASGVSTIASNPTVKATSQSLVPNNPNQSLVSAGAMSSSNSVNEYIPINSDILPTGTSKYVPTIYSSSVGALNNMLYEGNSGKSSGIISAVNSQSIVITRYVPKMVIDPSDDEFIKLNGRPCGKTMTLSELEGTGYAEIPQIHLEGAGFGLATESELSMIEQSLAEGVLL